MNKVPGWSRVVGCLAVVLVLASVGCRRGGEDPEVQVSEAESVADKDGNRYGAPERSYYTPVQPGSEASDDERPLESRPAADDRPERPVAVAIPGKSGFVFNPYTNGIVDVRGVPPGTLVRDPADPDQSHMFRVPD